MIWAGHAQQGQGGARLGVCRAAQDTANCSAASYQTTSAQRQVLTNLVMLCSWEQTPIRRRWRGLCGIH